MHQELHAARSNKGRFQRQRGGNRALETEIEVHAVRVLQVRIVDGEDVREPPSDGVLLQRGGDVVGVGTPLQAQA